MPRFDQWAGYKHFRLVVAVEEYGSVSKAAAALNLSQPTASRMVTMVEEALGAPLFIRTGRGLEPTPLGREFARHSRTNLAMLRHTAESFDALVAGDDGRIFIGTLLTAASRVLPTALAALRRKRPGITFSIVEGTSDSLLPRLIAGELDIVLGRLSEPSNDIVQEVLYQDRLCFVARRDHPIISPNPIPLAALREADWILPPPETAVRRQFDHLFHHAGLSAPRPVVESVSLLSNRHLLMNTDMLGVWSRTVMESGPDLETLVVLKTDLPSAVGPIGISRRRDAVLSPPTAALLDELRTAAEARPQ